MSRTVQAPSVVVVFAYLLACLIPLATVAEPLAAAGALIREGRLDEAERSIRMSGAPESHRAIWQSRVHHERGEHEEAVRLAKQAVEELPENSDAHLSLAAALRGKMSSGSKLKAMMTVGSYKRAFRRSLELNPRNLDAREEEIGYYTWAPGIAGGDKDTALSKAQELRTLDAKRGRQAEIMVLDALERKDEALRVSAELVAENPDDHDLRSGYARRLQGAERWAEADEHLNELAALDEPRHRWGAIYQLGRSRVLGNFELETAVTHFESYLAEAPRLRNIPSKAAAHWRLGMALAGLGRKSEARSHYEKALELEPEFKQARQSLDDLEG